MTNESKIEKTPRTMSVVTANGSVSTPFIPGKSLLFLGKIANMDTKCAVVDIETGKIVTGLPCSAFTEV